MIQNISLLTHLRHQLVPWRWVVGMAIATGTISVSASPLTAQTLALPSSGRWLEVQQINGGVIYHGTRQTRDARIGDRILQIDEGVDTETLSASVLAFDSNIGTVRVAESTRLRVRRMDLLPDGGRVTSLVVDQGRARLQVRRFTHPSSHLEIETPAGVAAVRGTTFDVNVGDTGKTAVATATGSVEVSAQDVTVFVNPGFVTSIIPGEPPTPPRRIDRQLRLGIEHIRRTNSQIVLRGRVDPVNTVQVNGNPVRIEEDGSFRLTLRNSPLEYAGSEHLTVIVHNPLEETRTYQVAIPGFRER
ncbi:MAG: FecR family protein [Cyanobacteria bacterium P01_E01_bin.6]